MQNDHFDILVVDDEESIRRVVSRVLIDDGHRVTTAETGEQALGLVLKQSFHLVITDIRMGGMDGLELLKKIRNIKPDIEVVIITSHASLDTAVKAIRDGAYDYLTKPFESLFAISSVAARAKDKLRLKQQKNELNEKLKKYNSQLKRANQELKELTTADSLTNLCNKHYFEKYFETELVRSHRYEHELSLFFMDVDYIKEFILKHGQKQGEELVYFVAELLGSNIRETDIACRYSGTEFVVVMPETSKEGAVALAEKIRNKAEDYPFRGRETQPGSRITVSIGVATYPNDGEKDTDIIQHALKALSEAKNSGHNKVVGQ